MNEFTTPPGLIAALNKCGAEKDGKIDFDLLSSVFKSRSHETRFLSFWSWIGILLILIIFICDTTFFDETNKQTPTIKLLENNKFQSSSLDLETIFDSKSLTKYGITSKINFFEKKSTSLQKSAPCPDSSKRTEVNYPWLCIQGIPIIILIMFDLDVPLSLFDNLYQTIALVIYSTTKKYTIPSSIYSHPLLILTLAGSMSGTMPTQLGLISSLQILILGNNYEYVEGTYPSELGQLKSINRFDFYGNDISGTIPIEIADLDFLELLYLNNNTLVGTIPTEFGKLTKLEYLAMQTNKFSGTIPTELGLATLINTIFLHENNFEGPIPSQFGLLSNISALGMQENELSGPIPSQIGLLTLLTTLNLQNNSLTGLIPSQLAQIKLLTLFDFSHNNFYGSIPIEILNLPNISIYCIDSGLSDPICQTSFPTGIDDSVAYTIISISALVAFATIIIAIYVLKNRNHQQISVNYYEYSIICLLGLELLTLSIIPFGISMQRETDDKNKNLSCFFFPEMMVNGITLMFSSIFCRNYPVYRAIYDSHSSKQEILNSPKPSKIPILIICAVSIIIATVYSVGCERSKNGIGCSNNKSESTILISLMTILEFLLIAGSCFTTIKLTHVDSNFNDINQIGKAIYSFLTFGVSMVILGILTDKPTILFLSISLSIIFSVITFLFAVFVRSFQQLKRLSRFVLQIESQSDSQKTNPQNNPQNNSQKNNPQNNSQKTNSQKNSQKTAH